jgi:hypothetical protein
LLNSKEPTQPSQQKSIPKIKWVDEVKTNKRDKTQRCCQQHVHNPAESEPTQNQGKSAVNAKEI